MPMVPRRNTGAVGKVFLMFWGVINSLGPRGGVRIWLVMEELYMGVNKVILSIVSFRWPSTLIFVGLRGFWLLSRAERFVECDRRSLRAVWGGYRCSKSDEVEGFLCFGPWVPVVVGGFEGVWVIFSAWMASSENGEGLGLEFGQGSPCFRPWPPLGLMQFVGLGGVSGSGGIWVKAGACLAKIGGKGVFRWKICQGSPCFKPWLTLGLVHSMGFGGVSGSRVIWVEAEACFVYDDGEVRVSWRFFQGPPVLGRDSCYGLCIL